MIEKKVNYVVASDDTEAWMRFRAVDEDEEGWVRDLLPRTWVPIGDMGLLYCVQGIMVDRSDFVPKFSGMIFVKLDNFNATSTYWSGKLYTEKAVRRYLFQHIYWAENQYREVSRAG